MTFERRKAVKWHRDVPGARWFKTDLHVHTIDDHQGRAKRPDKLTGPLESEKTITKYARRLLQSAVKNGVQVLGLTPHSPRVGTSTETSAVWRIVEVWNSGDDDDGRPFREKIYAVFPGFEPNLNHGKKGLHLLFLFDPEIGRHHYLTAFDIAMGGVSPWKGNNLRMSSKNAEKVFHDLREWHQREAPRTGDGGCSWSYIVLAPHIDSDMGLLGAQKAQVLELFQHENVAGLELGDEKLPQDTEKNRQWLIDGMVEHRQAFFHSSDAYSVDEIGKRYTWMKLASPRIEALRQAFIANDSRMQIAYDRDDEDGSLQEIADPPDVTKQRRKWLRSVTVEGGASFFQTDGSTETSCRFDLSPDLTCIIGGSMTGKSTFLDGLRVHIVAPLPFDDGLERQVIARGKERFLAGSPAIKLDCPGKDSAAPLHEQWPAEFYTQNELQRLAQQPGAVEDILARLALPSETSDIQDRENRLCELDRELVRTAKHLAKLDEEVADAEQAYERSRKAADELVAFADAGIEDIRHASSALHRWREIADAAKGVAANLGRTRTSAKSVDLLEADDSMAKVLSCAAMEKHANDLREGWSRVHSLLDSASGELDAVSKASGVMVSALAAHEGHVREEVNRKLADRGLDGARINEFQALSGRASLLDSYQANLDQLLKKCDDVEREFEASLKDRKELVDEQRNAFDRVVEKVSAEHAGRISARRLDNGEHGPLDRFLRGLKQKGVTRWWNDSPEARRPSPTRLLAATVADKLAEVGMSSAVQATFRECLPRSKQRELAAIRCPDRYVIELRMDDGGYRPLADLSGGQRVSVLLSLLLKTNDHSPLVIDQPEDELDNRFLFNTVLPVLKELKGQRQIIVATHNANIVVNGDADIVIQLEATASRGWIASTGTIEEPAVRDAIVRTVDGGDEAFRLRRLKYGF